MTYARGLRTSIVNNGSAHGYSAATTLAYVATTNSLGSPAGGQLLLFAVGAGLGFAFVATMTYILLAAVELATARAWQEARDDAQETYPPPADQAADS